MTITESHLEKWFEVFFNYFLAILMWKVQFVLPSSFPITQIVYSLKRAQLLKDA